MSDHNERAGILGTLLRHPLANVVIGFVLTGVLGTTLTQYYISLREKQSKQYELAATRKDSIAKLAALNAEYLARAEMFLTAIDRGDADAAKELKGMFDDAAMRWKTETSPTLMVARDLLPAEIYVRIRNGFFATLREVLGIAAETLRSPVPATVMNEMIRMSAPQLGQPGCRGNGRMGVCS